MAGCSVLLLLVMMLVVFQLGVVMHATRRAHGTASRRDLVLKRAVRVTLIVRAGAFGFVMIYQRCALQKGQAEAILFGARQGVGGVGGVLG